MTESDDEKSTVKMKRPIGRIVAVILAVPAIAVLAVLAVMYLKNLPKPATGLGLVELGMSEMDVTLAYGRSPDCVITESETETVWRFHGSEHCSTKLQFKKEGLASRLTLICGGGVTDSINYGDDEKSALSKLGMPSFVSVSEDGTQKISNFEKYNVALTFRGGDLESICVSSELPLRFTNEYPRS